MHVWSDCEAMWILWPSHLLDYYRVKFWVQSRPTAHSRKARHHRRCMTPQKLPIFRSKFLLILLGLDQLRCVILQASLPQWLWWWCSKCDTKLWLHLLLCKLQWDNHSHAGRASADMPWPFVLLYFACRSYSGPEKQQSRSCFRWYNLRLHVALDNAGPSTGRGQQLKCKSVKVVNEPTAQHILYFWALLSIACFLLKW